MFRKAPQYLKKFNVVFSLQNNLDDYARRKKKNTSSNCAKINHILRNKFKSIYFHDLFSLPNQWIHSNFYFPLKKWLWIFSLIWDRDFLHHEYFSIIEEEHIGKCEGIREWPSILSFLFHWEFSTADMAREEKEARRKG